MSEWPEVRVSELATIDIGGTPSRAVPAFWAEKPNGYPWISIADLKGKYVSDTKEHITALGVKSSNVKLIPERTAVMSFKLTVGRVAITAKQMYCNEAIAIFRPKDGRLEASWLYHALPRAAGSVVTDTAVKGATLNKAKMAEMSLRLPPPSEQATIARVLDTLDSTIHETEAIIAKLKAVKQGLLHDLLTRGIDANGELRPPQAEAPHRYKQSPLGWIPREWALKTLGQILSEPTRNGLYKPSQFHGRGPLMIQMGGLFAGEAATFETASRVQVTPFELNSFGLAIGDLLFARRSLVFEGAGQCVIVRDLSEPATFESSIVRVRVKADEALPEFVCQFLRGHASGKQRRTLIRQVAVSGVSSQDIRELFVPLPSPQEQTLAMTRLEAIQRRLDSERASLNKLRSQKAGLMDDLLTGHVRVTALLAGAEREKECA